MRKNAECARLHRLEPATGPGQPVTPQTELDASRQRFDALVERWGVTIERVLDTGSSIIAMGRQQSRPVVLKVVKNHGDEWRCGETLRAFDGCGTARVYESTSGAVLMERLLPGHALSELHESTDAETTGVLAGLISRMRPQTAPPGTPPVRDWAGGFERYLASDNHRIPRELVEDGRRVFVSLCESQSQTRLLHGDLHHCNVLFDAERGWLAIDPKGVTGEVEYEIGAMLRNPVERPALFTGTETIRARVESFAASLDLDVRRILAWGYAQAVLSAIWRVEDGETLEAGHSSLVLARAIRPMLKR